MRIRTIKPEFFEDEKLAKYPPHARLLFIGLWCLADKNGVLEDRPEWIRARVFPYEHGETTDVSRLLPVLVQGRHVIRYQAEGRPLLQVRNFSRHQRITGKEAEGNGKYPVPTEENGQGKQWGNNGETSGCFTVAQEREQGKEYGYPPNVPQQADAEKKTEEPGTGKTGEKAGTTEGSRTTDGKKTRKAKNEGIPSAEMPLIARLAVVRDGRRGPRFSPTKAWQVVQSTRAAGISDSNLEAFWTWTCKERAKTEDPAFWPTFHVVAKPADVAFWIANKPATVTGRNDEPNDATKQRLAEVQRMVRERAEREHAQRSASSSVASDVGSAGQVVATLDGLFSPRKGG